MGASAGSTSTFLDIQPRGAGDGRLYRGRCGAGPFTLTLSYNKTTARSLAEKQIALAGARLAKILNEELK
jgi:hypothetical protein